MLNLTDTELYMPDKYHGYKKSGMNQSKGGGFKDTTKEDQKTRDFKVKNQREQFQKESAIVVN